MINEHFTYLAAAITLAGNSYYAVSAYKGTIRPNIMSWILWSAAPLVTFFAQLSQGVTQQSILSLAVGVSPIFIIITALIASNGGFKLTKLDVVCAVSTFMALLLWLITGKGSLAIILSIIAGCFAGLPTLIKSYKDPGSENATPFVCGSISAMITLATLNTFAFSTAGFAIYLMLSNLVLVFFIAIWPAYNKGRFKWSSDESTEET
jgi:hypothetical protein